jgi:hypothetical protein
MTRTLLMATLKERRAAWEAALAAVPRARWCEPGTVGAWSVKDIIVQIVYQEQWCADRLGEARRGEAYAPCAMDELSPDERAQLLYRQHCHRPLADVLAEAHFSFRRLLREVETHNEASLPQPQAFAGAASPRLVWQGLWREVGEHYDQHTANLRAWRGGGA